jgi:hypothetical protein
MKLIKQFYNYFDEQKRIRFLLYLVNMNIISDIFVNGLMN